MRALVTGVAGQDGSLLAELLLADGHEVVGMVHRDGDVPDGVDTVRGDLLDPDSLRRVVAEVRPQWLFHLAAPSYVPDSWRRPVETFTAIPGATAVLLDAAVEADPDVRVYLASSSEVFGDAGESPQDEGSPCRPRTPYGVAKLAALQLGRVWRSRGAHVSSGITYNHESERRPERFVTRKITMGVAAMALGLQDELVLGDLDAVRDWSAARDVVRAAVLMVRQDEPGDYVIASGTGRTVRELVEAACAAAGVDPAGRIRVDPAFVRPPEATPQVGNPRRARERLGWRPEIGFDELIASMVSADLKRLRARAA
ncbi:MAG TPA: GDP-mannose 4,6-dehydratase [Capillimicrobium sp.]|nr:GDP-mannose 4,6-dehydratase [Capillimicrobium sp.]